MLVLGMTAALADGASITIHRDPTYDASSSGSRTYTAYKVFDASYVGLSGANTEGTGENTFTYNGKPVSYTMATNSPWLTAFDNASQVWFTKTLAADGSKFIITPTAQATDANAAAIAAYFAANVPNGLAGTTITPEVAAAVDPGYYVIVPSDGAANLTLVTTDVTIYEKNTYMTTDKTVAETSYNIGDTVTYTATVNIPADTKLTPATGATDADYVILKDQMDSVLAFKGASSVSATVDGAAFTDFTVLEGESRIDATNDTFEIKIPVTETNGLRGKTIIFTYQAEVTSAAATETGLVNKLFGQKNGYTTPEDQVIVYTFEIKLNKTFTGATGSDSDYTATFELRTTANDTNTAYYFTNSGLVYTKTDNDDQGGSKTLTIHHNETIDIKGLDAGTYYLVETSTKEGYNLLTDPIEVKVTDLTTGTQPNLAIAKKVEYKLTPTSEFTEATNYTVPVVNNSGNTLPSTGGIGTTLFYIGGGILVLLAVVMLVTKKRMKAED